MYIPKFIFAWNLCLCMFQFNMKIEAHIQGNVGHFGGLQSNMNGQDIENETNIINNIFWVYKTSKYNEIREKSYQIRFITIAVIQNWILNTYFIYIYPSMIFKMIIQNLWRKVDENVLIDISNIFVIMPLPTKFHQKYVSINVLIPMTVCKGSIENDCQYPFVKRILK